MLKVKLDGIGEWKETRILRLVDKQFGKFTFVWLTSRFIVTIATAVVSVSCFKSVIVSSHDFEYSTANECVVCFCCKVGSVLSAGSQDALTGFTPDWVVRYQVILESHKDSDTAACNDSHDLFGSHQSISHCYWVTETSRIKVQGMSFKQPPSLERFWRLISHNPINAIWQH